MKKKPRRKKGRRQRRPAPRRKDLSWDLYKLRDYALAEMGFGSYRAYLASPLWRAIRLRVLRDPDGKKRKCRLCPEKARQVHHRSYGSATLRGEDDSPLIALCIACHERMEFCGNRKRSPTEAEEELRLLLPPAAPGRREPSPEQLAAFAKMEEGLARIKVSRAATFIPPSLPRPEKPQPSLKKLAGKEEFKRRRAEKKAQRRGEAAIRLLAARHMDPLVREFQDICRNSC